MEVSVWGPPFRLLHKATVGSHGRNMLEFLQKPECRAPTTEAVCAPSFVRCLCSLVTPIHIQSPDLDLKVLARRPLGAGLVISKERSYLPHL